MAAVTTLIIAAEHPALPGHFPGAPIVPGVLLLDAALQALGSAASDVAGWHIASAKFHRAVLPGESLQLQCTPQPGTQFRIEIRAAEALILSALIERRAA